MAQLWGGRFTKETDKLVYNFNASIEFDKKFYREDIMGSKAHVKMLGKVGILTQDETEAIEKELDKILKDVESGQLLITDEYEDIHSFVEANLIDRLGDVGKKLHTGRSRNDQVALDMRLYTREQLDETDVELKKFLQEILTVMKENTQTVMPGFTHMQKAQPITLAHHLGAYFEMFKRDRQRLFDIRERMNYCPLGSGALAGTTYPLDREYTAELLEFNGPTLNSIDGVSDRDYLIEFLSALSTIMMHLSRFSEEIITWNSNEYGFVEIDDAYSTGSSIMPQKKNPDIAELVRGKTGRVYGALMSLLTTMKGIPLAYNKDMQEDKEVAFDAMDTVKGCIALFRGMISTMKFNKERMEKSAKNGFTNATDAADYLVKNGVPFRDAHGIVGKIVLYCLEKNISIDEMNLEELKAICPVFKEDVYEAISLETCVNTRLTIGAPSKDAMEKVIKIEEEYLEKN
ncbi:argininosuccinate lyase [Lachnospiraceae bacterium C7]|nr:argininosuccinate lyase [Lachnospiraceae bacterium C7]